MRRPSSNNIGPALGLALGLATAACAPKHIRDNADRDDVADAMIQAVPQGRENAVAMADRYSEALAQNYAEQLIDAYRVMLAEDLARGIFPRVDKESPVMNRLAQISAYTADKQMSQLLFYKTFEEVLLMQVDTYKELHARYLATERSLTLGATVQLSARAAGTNTASDVIAERREASDRVEEASKKLDILQRKLEQISAKVAELEAIEVKKQEEGPNAVEQVVELTRLGQMTGMSLDTIAERLKKMDDGFQVQASEMDERMKELDAIQNDASLPEDKREAATEEIRELSTHSVALVDARMKAAEAMGCIDMKKLVLSDGVDLSVDEDLTDLSLQAEAGNRPSTGGSGATGGGTEADIVVGDGTTTVDFIDEAYVEARRMSLADQFEAQCAEFNNLGTGEMQNPFAYADQTLPDWDYHQEVFMAAVMANFGQELDAWRTKSEGRRSVYYDFAGMWEDSLTVAADVVDFTDIITLASRQGDTIMDDRVREWHNSLGRDPQAGHRDFQVFTTEALQYGHYDLSLFPNGDGRTCTPKDFADAKPEVKIAGDAMCGAIESTLQLENGTRLVCSQCSEPGIEFNEANGQHVAASTFIIEANGGSNTRGMIHPQLNFEGGNLIGPGALSLIVTAGTLDAVSDLDKEIMKTTQKGREALKND